MANNFGGITLSTTGTGASAISFTGFGFNPNDLVFEVGAKNGASAVLTSSLGAVDSAGTGYVLTEYDDHAGNYTYNTSTSYCIWLRRHNGSTWIDELRASFHSFITDGFKLNVDVANSNYSVYVQARST